MLIDDKKLVLFGLNQVKNHLWTEKPYSIFPLIFIVHQNYFQIKQ